MEGNRRVIHLGTFDKEEALWMLEALEFLAQRDVREGRLPLTREPGPVEPLKPEERN